MNNKIPIVLTIAGSDSGGGAGIQADIKVLSALQTYAASVITAVTAQNTLGVDAIHTLPADFVASQMKSLAKDMHIDAVKLGMLANEGIIAAVSQGIANYGWQNVVLDPVMVAQSGDRLLDPGALDRLTKELFPLATLITPNLPEAALLLEQEEEEVLQDPWQAARSVQQLGCHAVLLKGGHNRGMKKGIKATDWLLINDYQEAFESEYIDTPNTHGSGCSLSSAIAAFLAGGMSRRDAVFHAKEYISGAISAGQNLSLGKGSGPLHHFYRLWQD